jgi:DNA-binding transcriptional LysR family regulator
MHLKELDANLIVVLDALLMDASVTKAAARLGRSPSAVSHALANLRYIFNDELFVRAGQRLAPTARAKELAPSVHIIVSGLESLLRSKEPFNPGTQERTFRFHCPEMAELYFLPKLRALIQSEAPNIHIERSVSNTEIMYENLRRGQTDFILIENEIMEDIVDMSWLKLSEEPYITLVSKKSEWKDKKITLKHFQSLPHVITDQSGKKAGVLEQTFIEKGLERQNLLKASSSLAGILMAIEMSVLVTVPHLHARLLLNHVAASDVTLPFKLPKMNIQLGWHRSFERDECHQWLREKIELCLREPERA